jgi:hypothetical protein
MLGMIVADIANPVFFGMSGAERAASDRGFTMLMVELNDVRVLYAAGGGYVGPGFAGALVRGLFHRTGRPHLVIMALTIPPSRRETTVPAHTTHVMN